MPVGETGDLVREFAAAGWTGFNVTHPCKQACSAGSTSCPRTRACSEPSTRWVVDGGRLVGHNTDHRVPHRTAARAARRGPRRRSPAGRGAVRDRRSRTRWPRPGCRIADRRRRRGSGRGRVCAVCRCVPPTPPVGRSISAHVADVLASRTGLVNATPIGMDGHSGTPVDPRHCTQVCGWRTSSIPPSAKPLLDAAAALGCATLDGGQDARRPGGGHVRAVDRCGDRPVPHARAPRRGTGERGRRSRALTTTNACAALRARVFRGIDIDGNQHNEPLILSITREKVVVAGRVALWTPALILIALQEFPMSHSLSDHATASQSFAQPLDIGGLRLRNRFVSAPMERNYCDFDGTMSDRYIAYLERRAAGGAALVCHRGRVRPRRRQGPDPADGRRRGRAHPRHRPAGRGGARARCAARCRAQSRWVARRRAR